MKYLITAVWLCISLILSGQDVRFEAQADAKQVLVNRPFEVRFTLYNAEGSQFTPPKFTDCRALNGHPGQSVSTTMINGKISKSMGWTYTLLGEKSGKIVIPPATVKSNGKTYQTQPITVEVVASAQANTATKGATVAPTGNKEVFVTAELSSEKAYAGAQVFLTYKLYTRTDVESFDILDLPKFAEFTAKELTRFDSRSTHEVVKGKEYTVKPLKVIALFPQQTGKIKISPAMFQMGVARSAAGNDDPMSIIFGKRLEAVNLSTNANELTVMPLPTPAPADFAGVAGRYTIEAKVDKANLTTDDAFLLQLTVKGTGDAKLFVAPALQGNPAFEAYPAKLIKEEVFESVDGLEHENVYEYYILPKEAGSQTLQAELAVFDPTQNNYAKVKAEPIALNITQGKGTVANQPLVMNDSPDASTGKWMDKFSMKGLWKARMLWGLAILPFLVLLFYLFFVKKAPTPAMQAIKSAPSTTPTPNYAAGPERLSRKADIMPVAAPLSVSSSEMIHSARKALQNQDRPLFFKTISAGLGNMVAQKLSLTNPQPGSLEIKEQLSAKGVSASVAENISNTVNICERILYSGSPELPVDEEQLLHDAEAAARSLDNELGKG